MNKIAPLFKEEKSRKKREKDKEINNEVDKAQKLIIIQTLDFDNMHKAHIITINKELEPVKIVTKIFYNETIKVVETTHQENVCTIFLESKKTKKIESTPELLKNEPNLKESSVKDLAQEVNIEVNIVAQRLAAKECFIAPK